MSTNTVLREGPHISLRKYLFGFALAVALTLLSFGVVIYGWVPHAAMLWVLFGAGIAQMLVHLHYFLHLDRSSAQRWNLIALAFTVLLLFVFVAGTLWVMLTLDMRMM